MPTAHKHCLLVIDDEREVCDSVYHLLRREYVVLRATNAHEALEQMAHNDVEIIMTDQRMPDMTGVEVLQRIRCRHPEAVRILFTGYADIDSVISAINQGHVYRYLTKPWQPEDVEAAVADAAGEFRRIVQRSRAWSGCMEKLAALEAQIGELQQRLARLERENAELRQRFEMRLSEPPGP